MEVGQPAFPPAVAPFDGQDDQVQGVPWLYLDPAGAAPARGIGRRERLDDDALVTPGDGVLEELRRLVFVGGDQARHQHRRGDHGGERGVPFGVGLVEQVGAVQVQHVEQENAQRDCPGALFSGLERVDIAGRARRGVLEGVGAAVRAQRDQFAVEDGVADGERGEGRHDLRQPLGDVVE